MDGIQSALTGVLKGVDVVTVIIMSHHMFAFIHRFIILLTQLNELGLGKQNIAGPVVLLAYYGRPVTIFNIL